MILFTLPFAQCKEKEKFYDSDYVVHNTMSEEISVYSSAYSYSQINGQTLVSYTDYISPGERFVLRNKDAKEDASLANLFHEMKIFRGNEQSPINPLQNSLWSKTRIGDDKFEYTLRVDTTYFP